MIADTSFFSILFADSSIFIAKIVFVMIAIMYFIFSLIVVRQVKLMTDTLMTEGTPILIGISIIHAGLALGIIILFIGIL